jgi:cytidylate kinase
MGKLKTNISIAIDGPSASGKSTIAKLLASKFGLIYIDTGAMYRAYTLACLNAGLNCQEEVACDSLIGAIDISFNELNHVTLNEVDVEEYIRGKDVSDNVSYIASYKNIRLFLVNLQRKFAAHNDVIMDGRDIGTYVLPGADLKIYQVADIEERAKRRYKENLEKGYKLSYEDTLNNLKKRDYIDSHRVFAPLRPAKDSIEINTTDMTIDQVVDKIGQLMKDRGLVK